MDRKGTDKGGCLAWMVDQHGHDGHDGHDGHARLDHD